MATSVMMKPKSLLRRVFNKALEPLQLLDRFEVRSSPGVKVAQRHLFNYYQNEIRNGNHLRLSDVGFRVYSEYEEDGILLYIFAAIGTKNRVFVDIGSSNGINSNAANLAINFGWFGLFIDGNKKRIRQGQFYYKKHRDTWAYPPRFVNALVQRENINQLIEEHGIIGEIDLLSIDIDGNDYWIWDALTIIQPRVVIIETHVEFGKQSIVVPYDKNYSFPGKHPVYHGASPVAMEKLAKKKGYRLVGANIYGFNTIYVKNGIGEVELPEVSVESTQTHPNACESTSRFEEVKDYDYLHV